jgi:hypothetical protein
MLISFFVAQNYVGNTWSVVSRWYADSGRLSPRTAHSAAYLPDRDALFIYGGYNLNSVLGDLLMFSFAENRWTSWSGNGTEQVPLSVPVVKSSAEGLPVDQTNGLANQSQLLNSTNKNTEDNTVDSESRGSAYLR